MKNKFEFHIIPAHPGYRVIYRNMDWESCTFEEITQDGINSVSSAVVAWVIVSRSYSANNINKMMMQAMPISTDEPMDLNNCEDGVLENVYHLYCPDGRVETYDRNFPSFEEYLKDKFNKIG